MAPSAPI
jgi:hypothetical protein